METIGKTRGDVVRLWIIGGGGQVVRWLEILAAALFTLEATGSGFAVAAVTAARALPMLLFGALAGVVSEAVDRKRILITGMLVTGASSLSISLLAGAGVLQIWHLATAAFVSGTMWTTDMSARRRMIGDFAAPGMISRAIAMDSLGGALTRMVGPILGAIAYDLVGLSGAYAGTALLALGNVLLALPIRHTQVTRKLALARLPRDLAEGLAVAMREPAIMAVLGVTVSMNMFVFVYSGLVAPIARMVFAVPTAVVGILAAAESLGALVGGMVLARTTLPLSPRVMMLGGSLGFAFTVALVPFVPAFSLACALLVIGGVGTAAFSNMQTTVILTDAPPAMRSRLLGLTAMCLGTGPLGQLMIGAMADRIGPMAAVEIMALSGIFALLLVGWYWTRHERVMSQRPAVAS